MSLVNGMFIIAFTSTSKMKFTINCAFDEIYLLCSKKKKEEKEIAAAAATTTSITTISNCV